MPPLRALLQSLTPVVVLGGGRLLAALAGFAAAALLARRVEPATLGLFAMAIALEAHAAQLAELGLRSYVTALAGRDGAAARAFLPRYVGVRLAAALLLLLLGALAAPLLLPAAPGVLVLALLALPLVALHADWAALARGRTLEAALLVALRPLLWCGLLLILPPPTSAGELVALWLLAWAGAVAAALPALRHLPQGRASPPPPLGTALRQALPLGISSLTGQLQLALDLYLVGLVLGPEAAGRYWLAASVAVAASVLANAGQQWSLARLARAATAPAALAAALRQTLLGLVLLGTFAAAALALVAPALVPLAFGPGHGEVAALLPAFAPWLWLRHATGVLQAAHAAAGRGRRLLRADGAAVAALLLGLALALPLGALGAVALSRAAAELVRMVSLLPGVGLGLRRSRPAARLRPQASG